MNLRSTSLTRHDPLLPLTSLVRSEGGLPSHCHFFGAWFDGGILAGLSWLAVLVISILAIMQGLAWRHPIVPVFIFVASTTIWDVIFSPGPHRMDMALRLTLLTFVLTFLAHARPAAASSPSETRSEEHTSELQSLMRTSYAHLRLKQH